MVTDVNINNIHYADDSTLLADSAEGLHKFIDRISVGYSLNKKWNHSREIKTRIQEARNVFARLRNALLNLTLNLHTRKRCLCCYVFSVLYYGVEAWTLMKRLEVFKLWCYRLRISRTLYVTNERVQ